MAKESVAFCAVAMLPCALHLSESWAPPCCCNTSLCIPICFEVGLLYPVPSLMQRHRDAWLHGRDAIVQATRHCDLDSVSVGITLCSLWVAWGCHDQFVFYVACFGNVFGCAGCCYRG